MQTGALSQSGDVKAWTCTVRVDGVTREATDVEFDGEVSSDLPEQVAGVTGIQPNTGTIRWAEVGDVVERPSMPWHRVRNWPPRPGSRIEVWVSDEATSWRVFTGKVDSTTGDPADGSLTSRIVDDWDDLSALVSVPVLADRMPAGIRAGEVIQPPVRTALEPWYVAHRALEAAGYGVQVPALVGRPLLRVLMQGSVAPSPGYLAGWAGDVSLAWARGYQYLASGATVTYDPAPQDRPATIGQRVYIKRHAAAPVSVRVEHVNGAVRRYRFSQVSANVSRLEVFASSPTVAEHSIGSADVPNSGSVETPWIDLIMGGPQSAAFTYVTASSYSSPATIPVSSAAPDSDVRTIQVAGGAVAVIVEYVWRADWTGQNFANRDGSRVHAWGAGLVRAMTCTRTIENQRAVDVLTDIAGSTLTGMWLDEHGVMQWAPSNVLESSPVVKTVTTKDDIFTLGWSEHLQAVRSQVVVAMDVARVTLRRAHQVLVWPADGGKSLTTIDPGEEEPLFIEPPADREWIEPDLAPRSAGIDADAHTDLNMARGSFIGGLLRQGTGSDERYSWAQASHWSHTIERLAMVKWLLTIQSLTASTQIVLATAPTGTALSAHRRNQPLPEIRARGEAQFTEIEVKGATRGPSWAPILTHSLRHWGTKADAQRVADWLASRLSTARVTLTGMTIDYDPRLQLGDKIRVSSPTLLGFEADGIIVGKHESHTSDGAELAVDLRITTWRTTATTIEELEAAYAGRNIAALESAWAGATVTAFETDPTGR